MKLLQTLYYTLAVIGGLCLTSNAVQAFDLKGDPNKPFSILGVSPIKEDSYESFYPILLDDVIGTRQEEGSLGFDMFRPVGKHDLYLLERWKGHAAFQYHLEQPYIKAVLDNRPAATPEGKEPTAYLLDEISYQAFKNSVNPENTYNVIGVLHIKPDRLQSFIDAAVQDAEVVRSYNGNLGFNVYQDQSDENLIIIVQRWENEASYKEHHQQNKFQKFNELLQDSVSGSVKEGWLEAVDVGRPKE